MAGPFARTRCSTTLHAILFVALLAGATSAGAVIAEPSDGPAPTDLELTLRAQYALDDPAFKKLHLNVAVRNGVATLHGAVPSTVVGEQAVVQLRTVPGLQKVINQTYVPSVGEAIMQSIPHPVMSQRPPVTNTTPINTATAVPAAPARPPSAPAPVVGEQPATLLPPLGAPAQGETLGEQV